MAKFTAPTPEQVGAHLSANEPGPPSRLSALLPLILLIALLTLALWVDHWLAMLLPLLAFALIVGVGFARARRMRNLHQRVGRAQELALLRHYPAALRVAWDLLPATRTEPVLNGRLAAALAMSLDQVGAAEAALAGYDHLLERLPRDHPAAIQLRVQRAICLLQVDRLFDADETLRSLRGAEEGPADSATGAILRLARLLQQVRTNHFADAVQGAATLVDDLRPLGVEAGYGHGLMAYAFAKLDDAAAPEQARQWWSRATALLSPTALGRRFRELTASIPGPDVATDDVLEAPAQG